MIVCTTSDLSAEMRQKIAKETQVPVVQRTINELSKREKNAVEILITYGNFDDAVTVEELRQLPGLKWIHVLSSGTEQLPITPIKDKNILVTSSKGIHAIPISEYVIFAVLYFAKHIPHFIKLQEQKSWSYTAGMSEVYGKTLGVLGTGVIGLEIARKARALGMSVIGVNRSGRHMAGFDEVHRVQRLKEIVPCCDYICSALPSTDETRNLIDKNIIQLMKDQVIFMNVGRGDVIVEEHLLEALRTGKIGGAALDVFKSEPLEAQHPFWRMKNVLITPHASARTNMYMFRALQMFLENFRYYQQNALQFMVNKVDFH
ncbi:D-2-hydroxyacid dehydrogenase [Siminovitchia sp. FSL H7-0308]|uniref:D-2-hydroxyacid dehydrogenase n=1 Tax=Siminovitchia sp. FSL H7-0308 TaxID=2921432 RepID=UPI0030EF2626